MGPMKTTARMIPALALGLVLVACGQDAPTASPSPSPTVSATPSPVPTSTPAVTEAPAGDSATPEGWRRIAVPEHGFSLAVPDEWDELSPDVISDSGIMEQLFEANPDAAVALEQAQAAIASGQIALFAFDTSEEGVASGFATNLNAINVGPVEGSAEQAADEVAEAIRQQIPILGDVETGTVSLPAGDAARVRYEWEIDSGDGTTATVTVTQYAIIANSGNGFILSMSAASESVDRYDDTFRQIAESFREEPT
jgi:hypothetical protein